MDLLNYPDPVARRIGREVLDTLAETRLAVLARRLAKARALTDPQAGRIVELRGERGLRPRVDIVSALRGPP